jgi:hypothetical protein
MHTTETTKPASAPEKLAYHRDELCTLLGLSVVSLWRLEKRGLLRRVPGLKVPLFSAQAVRDFLEGRTATGSNTRAA